MNLKQKVRSLSLEMANINSIFYKIRKWSCAGARWLADWIHSDRQCSTIGKLRGPVSSILACIGEHRNAGQKRRNPKERKERRKKTINNLIVIRVLEPNQNRSLSRKYYADHFHTHTHTKYKQKQKQKHTETRSQFFNKIHLKCASSDGKLRINNYAMAY